MRSSTFTRKRTILNGIIEVKECSEFIHRTTDHYIFKTKEKGLPKLFTIILFLPFPPFRHSQKGYFQLWIRNGEKRENDEYHI